MPTIEVKKRGPLCIYHKNCADGFGAAWVVKMALGDVEFFPAAYGEEPPDVGGRRVYMVDFSYKRPVLLEMAKKAELITIIDHHKTSAEDLVDLPGNVETIFDMERSGAVLAWEYFFTGSPVPELLLTIQDRDLWRFERARTKEIMAALFSHPYDFSVWDSLIREGDSQLELDGAAILRNHVKSVKEVIEASSRMMTIGGYVVPVVNAPFMMASDACNIMAAGFPFAASYWDSPSHRNFSLRSSVDGVDVSEVAKGYGGGGHKHASGFRVPLSEINALGLL